MRILIHATASGIEGTAQVIVPTSTNQQHLPLEVAKQYGRQWRRGHNFDLKDVGTV